MNLYHLGDVKFESSSMPCYLSLIY